MPKLQINFGAGFKDTRVVIEIDSEPVEDRILNTDYSTGFSFGKTYELDTHSTLLEIKLPALKLAESIDLELVQETTSISTSHPTANSTPYRRTKVRLIFSRKNRRHRGSPMGALTGA